MLSWLCKCHNLSCDVTYHYLSLMIINYLSIFLTLTKKNNALCICVILNIYHQFPNKHTLINILISFQNNNILFISEAGREGTYRYNSRVTGHEIFWCDVTCLIICALDIQCKLYRTLRTEFIACAVLNSYINSSTQ